MSDGSRRILFSILFCLLATSRLEGGTLYLPRQFQTSEMSTVGIALVNPTTTAALVTFRLKSSDGITLATTERTIANKGQMSVTLDQLFPAGGAGYVALDVDNYDVTGFWMTGNFSTSTDGAPLMRVTEAGPFPSFSFVLQKSEITVVNTGSSAANGNLSLRDGSGATVARVPFEIAGQGSFQRSVASLFPSQSASFDTTAYSIGVSSTSTNTELLGTAVAPNGNADNVITNATNFVNSELIFPHVVDGTIGRAAYRTSLTIHNPRTTGKNLTITLNSISGSRLSAQRPIPPFGTLRLRLVDLFNVASVDGWLSVETDTDYVNGWATYADLVNGGSTAFAGQSGGDTGILFGHIADLSPWWTGIALANPTSTDAQVEVYALDSIGRLIAGPGESTRASFTLAAGSKRAFLLSEIISLGQLRSVDGGYVFIRTTNAVPIFGIELFFLRNGFVYSNVPARTLDGLPFTPPGTSTSGPVFIQEVYTGDENQQRKSSFRPGDKITLNMVVNNGTGQTVNVVRRYRATGAQSGPFIDFMLSGTQGSNVTTRFTSQNVPSDAPTGSYTFIATVEHNGNVSSMSTTFLVSSAPVQRTLNVTKSGTGNGIVTAVPSGIDCGATCTAQYSDGDRVVLTAAPSLGTTFTGWSGACTGTTTCALTMDNDKNVTATFDATASNSALPTQALQLFKDRPTSAGLTIGTGNITSDPPGIICGSTCGGHFAAGTRVVLTAVPDTGSTFTGWTGDCTASALQSPLEPGASGRAGPPGPIPANPTCAITLNADKKVRAVFAAPSGGGEGGPVFSGATGIRLNVDPFPSVTSVVGTVTSQPAAINCTNRDSASSYCFTEFALGLPVILTATAAPGWVFKGWSGQAPIGTNAAVPGGDCQGTDPCTVVAWAVGAGGTIRARFEPVGGIPGPAPPTCVTAPVIISASAGYGLITFVNIQGVFAGFIVPPAAVVRVNNVPRGNYSVQVATTGRGLVPGTVGVGCGINSFLLK
jgi:hypothetical protein